MKKILIYFALYTYPAFSQEIDPDLKNFLSMRIQECQNTDKKIDLSETDRAFCAGKFDSYVDCWVFYFPEDYQGLK